MLLQHPSLLTTAAAPQHHNSHLHHIVTPSRVFLFLMTSYFLVSGCGFTAKGCVGLVVTTKGCIGLWVHSQGVRRVGGNNQGVRQVMGSQPPKGVSLGVAITPQMGAYVLVAWFSSSAAVGFSITAPRVRLVDCHHHTGVRLASPPPWGVFRLDFSVVIHT
ncbi:hypothetical protein Tco_1541383 [Tanacetum coccineum]